MNALIEKLRGSLIVSSQASLGEPLCAPEHICAMALSALNGGAHALRLEGLENIAFVRKQTNVPIVGLTKTEGLSEAQRLDCVYITATKKEVEELAASKSDIIALDATARPRPDNSKLKDLIETVQSKYLKPVWADISTYDEALQAAEFGVDIMSTTMSGYTKETYLSPRSEPDFALLEKLCQKLSIPVVLEGRVWSPEHITRAFNLGAFAVVVGSAITRPQIITERFVEAIPEKIRHK